VDIVGIDRANAWQNYLTAQFPDVKVVLVESYVTKKSQNAKKKRRIPRIPQSFKERLILALKETHEEMLEPPKHIRYDPEKAKKWIPRVKKDIDWNKAHLSNLDDSAPTHVKESEQTGDDDDDDANRTEPDFLTIGLVGMIVFFTNFS
jgi:hypothetical protein